jgi:hypothetical protein
MNWSLGAFVVCLLAFSLVAGSNAAAPVAEAKLESLESIPGLGSMQGVSVVNGLVYLYGDADPGVIREYRPAADGSLTATGRKVALTAGGKNVINHPTGLAVRPGPGTCLTYLGNTVRKKGSIYRLDWERMWRTGTLDGGVLNVAEDDLAVQGARPEFVRLKGRWLLATSDYGPSRNAVRLYDPTLLASAAKTSAAGVLVARFPTGPWVQNLHWLGDRGLLVVVQNITEGLGWRLTFADLAASVAAGATTVRQVLDLPRRDELEGFYMLDPTRGYGVSSSNDHNVALIRFAWRGPALGGHP